MARLTVEDCLHELNNRFELVLCAAKRAKDLERGAEPLVPWDNDKPTVVALREIAEGLINQNGKPIDPIKLEETETVITAKNAAGSEETIAAVEEEIEEEAEEEIEATDIPESEDQTD